MAQHEIRVEPFQGCSEYEREGIRVFYTADGTTCHPVKWEHRAMCADSMPHVAICPACKRARGLTEMEYHLLQVELYHSVQQCSVEWHNALFNSPADGQVEVSGI